MRTGFGLLALTVFLGASVPATSADLPPVAYEQFASGYVAPCVMLPYRDGEHAFVVVEQTGVARFLGEIGGKPGSTFLDLRDRIVKLRPKFDERGFLGLAFHPKFAGNGKLYVYYSGDLRDGAPEGYDHTARVSEFRVPEGSHAADPSSERVLLMVDQPQWSHNCGNIVFGADGFLYVGLGDGGGPNDTADGHEKDTGNGQALHRLLGKILRIDVDSGEPYGIPADNPLVGKEGRDEIYAWGIRNPWGISVDHGGDGDLIVADVGQNRFEEINIVEKGRNYGWSRREGFASFDAENAGEVVSTKAPPTPKDFADPVLVYPHNEAYGEAPGYGISITGGYVYRGKALPGLVGAYVFADWGTSWATRKAGLFAGIPESSDRWSMHVLPGAKTPGDTDAMVVAFGQDRDGELYVLTNGSKGPSGESGKIWKIVPGK